MKELDEFKDPKELNEFREPKKLKESSDIKKPRESKELKDSTQLKESKKLKGPGICLERGLSCMSLELDNMWNADAVPSEIYADNEVLHV